MASKTPLMREIEANWRDHRPQLHADLKAKGTLTATLRDEAERMTTEVDALTDAGMRPDEAMEKVRPEYLTPPSQEPPMSAADRAALKERHETWMLGAGTAQDPEIQIVKGEAETQ